MKPRRAGVMIPLFSLTSSRSWGIGEYRDVATFARWLHSAGQSFLQILPITELPETETSPYSALTAMAIDPMFIALPALEDFDAIGGEAQLPADDCTSLDRLRASARVRYREVRALKGPWLRRAYQRFADAELSAGSERARRFAAFCEEHAPWLDDYALFRAIRQERAQAPWWDWPEPLARRDATRLAHARHDLRDEIAYRKYLQWIAAEQWADARRDAAPVQIFGDVPFMISSDSPDVWTRQSEFRFDATVGVPPDAFSETGQDWGLPPWRWDVMAGQDFDWMKMRAQRTAELFDGFRLDHLVGLYRTYLRPRDQNVEAFFAPADEPTQLALGERLVSLYASTGAEVIAEDLGTVPDFVRASLERLQVPGFKVMRWERRWKEEGQPYIDPSDYPSISVGTTGTHDTEPLITWWDSLEEEERAEVRTIPSVRRQLGTSTSELDALLRALLAAQSYLTILPLQDLCGWSERINTPAQVSEENWSWRLPWPVDEWLTRPDTRARAEALAMWTRESGRNA
jgi:4-alpha-glucanotransferase